MINKMICIKIINEPTIPYFHVFVNKNCQAEDVSLRALQSKARQSLTYSKIFILRQVLSLYIRHSSKRFDHREQRALQANLGPPALRAIP